jgi:hypothetical protein
LVIIVLAQLQMAINVSVLPVSLGPISKDLAAPAAATATAFSSTHCSWLRSVAINEEARLRALRASFLIAAGISCWPSFRP